MMTQDNILVHDLLVQLPSVVQRLRDLSAKAVLVMEEPLHKQLAHTLPGIVSVPSNDLLQFVATREEQLLVIAGLAAYSDLLSEAMHVHVVTVHGVNPADTEALVFDQGWRDVRWREGRPPQKKCHPADAWETTYQLFKRMRFSDGSTAVCGKCPLEMQNGDP